MGKMNSDWTIRQLARVKGAKHVGPTDVTLVVSWSMKALGAVRMSG